jgi:hypothetical protein
VTEDTREARGLAVMLLAAVGGGAIIGYLLAGMHPLYLPLVSPALAGGGVGVLISMPRRLFRVGTAWQCALLAVLGGAIAYATYHVVVYLKVVDLLASRMPDLLDLASNPRGAVLAFFERETGEEGWLAYLTFTSRGPRATTLSPLGQAARFEPGAGAALAIMGVDLLAVCGAAWMALRGRTRWVDERAVWEQARLARRTRRIIAHVDPATLVEALRAIDDGKFEEAGRILARSAEDAAHAIAIIYDLASDAPWDLEVLETVPGAGMVVRASRRISSWEGQLLWDELRSHA